MTVDQFFPSATRCATRTITLLCLFAGSAGAQATLLEQDPYRWLEDTASTDARAWVRAADSAARSALRSGPDALRIRDRVEAYARTPAVTPPRRFGEYTFWTSRLAIGPGGQAALHVMGPGIARGGKVVASVAAGGGYWPSPNGELVAVAELRQGSERRTIRFVPIHGVSHLPDSIPSVHRTEGSLVWTPDGSVVYFVGPLDGGAGGKRIAGFAVGTGRVRTIEEFGTRSDSLTLALAGTPGGRLLLVTATDNRSGHTRLGVTALGDRSAGVHWVGLPPGPLAPIGEVDGSVFVISWGEAPNGRVLRVDDANGAATWREVVPEKDRPIQTWGSAGGALLGGRLVIGRVGTGGSYETTSYSLDGQDARPLVLDATGSVWSGLVGRFDSDTAWFQESGLMTPGTVRGVRLTTGTLLGVWEGSSEQQAGPAIVREHLEVSMDDGALVPVDVIRRADVSRDGRSPLILYAYGFGGWVAAPWFQPAMAAWVDAGGTWAVAGVRGGGEHGETWHAAGAGRNKERAITDYLEVARWLQQEQYTRADRLVANASSAGGPLVAASTLREPATFGAVLLDYVILDMLRYHLFGHASQWANEYGTADDPDDRAVLSAYSPYRLALGGACPPPLLAAPGQFDATAPSWHAAKFIAALVDRRPPGCDRGPWLLRMTWGGGHNAGSSLQDAVDTWTDELRFLTSVLPEGALHW